MREVSLRCIRHRYSSQPCNPLRHQPCRKRLAPNHSPTDWCRSSPRRYCRLYGARSSCTCLTLKNTLQGTCSCCPPECSFCNRLHRLRTYNTSKQELIKKEKKNIKKHSLDDISYRLHISYWCTKYEDCFLL